MLARAFRDNPLNVAVIGDSPARRMRCNRAGISALLASTRRHGLLFFAEVGTELLGALAAVPPYANPLPAPAPSVQLRTLLSQGFRVASRWGTIARRLHVLHPQQPHWYVASLGVEPAAQGQGLGASLLTRLLEHADHAGFPTYLETDRILNVGFYESRGFRVEEQIALLGVPVWRMWRAPS